MLSIMLRRDAVGGFILGCNFKNGNGNILSISHLLFADDTIIFCEAKEDQLLHLSWIFWSEASSGLKINLDKSELIPMGNVVNLNVLATELGCRTGHLPSTYLGLPLGASHKSVTMWDNIEERMRKRLALWKRSYISKEGKVTLIKGILASLPLYQMSMVRTPVVVAKRLEKLQRNFLWGGRALEKKAHLEKWEVVCSGKGLGSLGLRNLSLMNKALLRKWIWSFTSNMDCTWKRLIAFKYGTDGLSWGSREAQGPFGMGLWKDILKESSKVKENWKFKVRNGTKIHFLTNHRCGPSTLSISFPSLFGIAANKHATMADAWDSSAGPSSWNPTFVKAFND